MEVAGPAPAALHGIGARVAAAPAGPRGCRRFAAMDLSVAPERRHAPPAGAATPRLARGLRPGFWTPRGSFGGHLTLLVGPGRRAATGPRWWRRAGRWSPSSRTTCRAPAPAASSCGPRGCGPTRTARPRSSTGRSGWRRSPCASTGPRTRSATAGASGSGWATTWSGRRTGGGLGQPARAVVGRVGGLPPAGPGPRRGAHRRRRLRARGRRPSAATGGAPTVAGRRGGLRGPPGRRRRSSAVAWPACPATASSSGACSAGRAGLAPAT